VGIPLIQGAAAFRQFSHPRQEVLIFKDTTMNFDGVVQDCHQQMKKLSSPQGDLCPQKSGLTTPAPDNPKALTMQIRLVT